MEEDTDDQLHPRRPDEGPAAKPSGPFQPVTVVHRHSAHFVGAVLTFVPNASLLQEARKPLPERIMKQDAGSPMLLPPINNVSREGTGAAAPFAGPNDRDIPAS